MKHKRIILISSIILALLIVVVVIYRFNKDEKPHFEVMVSSAVTNAENIISTVFKGKAILNLDAQKLTGEVLKVALTELKDNGRDFERVTLWMPGETRWLIIAFNGKISADAVMNVLAEQVQSCSLAELFSNYVGERAEILPALEGVDLSAEMRPEFLVTREVDEIKWLDWQNVDADIAKLAKRDLRSKQLVRRMILTGNIRSSRGEIDPALDAWSRAAKLNPKDTFLAERIDHLRVNAEVFIKVGKFGMAAKCYETIIVINPNDVEAIRNLGHCYRQLGKPELANEVLKRAETLSK